jgi:cobalt-zinc-cadmium efflux system outer membrane protein
LSFLVALLFSADAAAQAWTETDVLSMAREGAPDVVSAEGRVEMNARSRDGVGLYPDSQLWWQRQANVDGQVAQDVVAVNVPIDLSGRRSAARSVVDGTTAFTEHQAIDARSSALADALRAFYEGVAAKERVEIAERAVEALGEAHRMISRREEEGTASGMDSMRLNLELELANSRLATARIEAQQTRMRLAVVLGRADAESAELEGQLDPGPSPPLSSLVESIDDQPVVEALRRSQAHISDARSSAASAWIPPLWITGGLNVETGTNVELGYFAGVMFNLPFATQGRQVMANAAARAALTDAHLDARTRRARADIALAHQRLVTLQAEATRFRGETEGELEGLLRAANTGYAEGRRSLVELLDARRAAIAVANRRLDLRLAARLAEVELRRASGRLR